MKSLFQRAGQQKPAASVKETGYTLMELIVSIGIIAALASVALPTYLGQQAEAKARTSQANMISIKQAFINNFYHSVIARHVGEFPTEPSDNLMTVDWASSTTLYDGKNIAQLFSEGLMVYNPFNHPYYYEVLPPSANGIAGFRITDPDIGIIMEYRP